MPKEVLNQYLGLQREADRQRMQLILQSAPLLKGVKMSCILIVEQIYFHMLIEELKHTQIQYKIFCEKSGRYTLLLYREEMLQTYLNQENVEQFLKQYGYRRGAQENALSLQKSLSLLAKRVDYFNHQAGGTFPHEIGVFLGYPMEDVIGFIENAGKNYLLNGYWKVYSDADRARQQFQAFDRARIVAAKEMFAGKSIREIVG